MEMRTYTHTYTYTYIHKKHNENDISPRWDEKLKHAFYMSIKIFIPLFNLAGRMKYVCDCHMHVQWHNAESQKKKTNFPAIKVLWIVCICHIQDKIFTADKNTNTQNNINSKIKKKKDRCNKGIKTHPIQFKPKTRKRIITKPKEKKKKRNNILIFKSKKSN